MPAENMINYALEDIKAPDIELLKIQALSAMIELPNEERIRIFRKYAERYGICL